MLNYQFSYIDVSVLVCSYIIRVYTCVMCARSVFFFFSLRLHSIYFEYIFVLLSHIVECPHITQHYELYFDSQMSHKDILLSDWIGDWSEKCALHASLGSSYIECAESLKI